MNNTVPVDVLPYVILASQVAESENALGIDVSKWQDDNSTPQKIDFEKARNAGAKFVFIKASQANWVDEDMLYNWSAAKLAGLPRGAYHYLTWDVEPEWQADTLLSVTHADPPEIMLVCDYEKPTGAPGRAFCTDFLRRFLEYVKTYSTRRIGIYTSPGFWGAYGSPDPYWAEYPLWIAHYTTAAAPIVPPPWTEWRFWQYSSHGPGLLFGAESLDLDMDFYKGMPAALYTWINWTPPEPEPEPEPSQMLRMRVIRPMLNIRAGPGTGYADLGDLHENDIVTVNNVSGNDAWVEITPGRWACVRQGSIQYLAKA